MDAERTDTSTLIQQVRALLDDQRLIAFTLAACDRLGVQLFERYSEVMFDSLIAQFEASSVTPEAVAALLNDDDRDIAMAYVVASVRSAKGLPEQEYPPDCPPDDEDEPAISRHLGMAKDFVARNLICFWLMDNRPEAMVPFLQAIRTPHAKRAAAAERLIFDSVR
jgi:hypothetical protein